jgi:spore maturation protein CgeB
LAFLRNAGIKIQQWGTGWETGRLSQEEMIRVFNQSRINLNLPNTSMPLAFSKGRGPSSLRRFVSRALDSVLTESKTEAPNLISPSQAAHGLSHAYAEQIKGRNFEIPGCGGFLVTGRAENLEDYYDAGKEVTCFEHEQDLISKVTYFLNHEDERRAIAQGGYERTLREHTYAHRFDAIFRRLGLTCEPLDLIFQGKVPPGRTQEVH